jgi:hypothetical protein
MPSVWHILYQAEIYKKAYINHTSKSELGNLTISLAFVWSYFVATNMGSFRLDRVWLYQTPGTFLGLPYLWVEIFKEQTNHPSLIQINAIYL